MPGLTPRLSGEPRRWTTSRLRWETEFSLEAPKVALSASRVKPGSSPVCGTGCSWIPQMARIMARLAWWTIFAASRTTARLCAEQDCSRCGLRRSTRLAPDLCRRPRSPISGDSTQPPLRRQPSVLPGVSVLTTAWRQIWKTMRLVDQDTLHHRRWTTQRLILQNSAPEACRLCPSTRHQGPFPPLIPPTPLVANPACPPSKGPNTLCTIPARPSALPYPVHIPHLLQLLVQLHR